MTESYDHFTSHPYKAGAEYAGLLPSGASNSVPSVKLHDVFGDAYRIICILLSLLGPKCTYYFACG